MADREELRRQVADLDTDERRFGEALSLTRQHPGVEVTVYSEADREVLRRQAARKRREADRLLAEAGDA